MFFCAGLHKVYRHKLQNGKMLILLITIIMAITKITYNNVDNDDLHWLSQIE